MAACIAIVLAWLLLAGGVFAQSTEPISEAEYWQRMERSEVLLERLLNEQLREGARAELAATWNDVDYVQVGDQVMQVEMDWLESPPNTDVVVEQRLNQVRALLDYHAHMTGEANPPSQETLSEVLQDPRFQYPTPTPYPTRQSGPERPNPNVGFSMSPEVAQLLLVMGVGAVVLVVLMYFARSLNVQRAVVEVPTDEDDPTTSQDASQRAGESEVSRDYRSAIRYLYLACLLLLDERGLIRYDRTLTNREHLRMIHDKPQLVELLRPVVSTFDDVWYGFMPVDENMYQQFTQNVERLRRLGT
jgi:hypothetical protein